MHQRVFTEAWGTIWGLKRGLLELARGIRVLSLGPDTVCLRHQQVEIREQIARLQLVKAHISAPTRGTTSGKPLGPRTAPLVNATCFIATTKPSNTTNLSSSYMLRDLMHNIVWIQILTRIGSWQVNLIHIS